VDRTLTFEITIPDGIPFPTGEHLAEILEDWCVRQHEDQYMDADQITVVCTNEEDDL